MGSTFLKIERIWSVRRRIENSLRLRRRDERGGERHSHVRKMVAVPASQPRLAAPSYHPSASVRHALPPPGAGRTSTASYLHHQRTNDVCVGLLWTVGLKRLVRAMFFSSLPSANSSCSVLTVTIKVRQSEPASTDVGWLLLFFSLPVLDRLPRYHLWADLKFWTHMLLHFQFLHVYQSLTGFEVTIPNTHSPIFHSILCSLR